MSVATPPSRIAELGQQAREKLGRQALKSGLPQDEIRKQCAYIDSLSDDDAIDHWWEVMTEGLVATVPTFERIGLGFYRATYKSTGWSLVPVITLQRVRESRGEIHGELSVRFAGDPDDRPDFLRSSFNVSSLVVRRGTARDLNERLKGDWRTMLENFCVAVLRAEARGPDLEFVGQEPRRSRDASYLLSPILPLGKACIIYGAGGTGKSTLAAAATVALLTGREVIPGWRPTPVPGMVLDWEGETRDWNDLVSKVAEGIGASTPSVPRLRMRRALADEVEAVSGRVAEIGAQFIVVDSVGLAIGASREGSAWHDGAFRLFEALRQLDVTTLLIDHIAGSELGNGSTAKSYGSVYKTNLARSVFELRQEKESAGERTELLLLHKKVNDGPKLPPQGFAILRDGIDGPIRFERVDVKAPDLQEQLPGAQRIDWALHRRPMSVKDLASTLDMKEATIRSILSRDGGSRFVRTPDDRIALAARPSP